MRDVTKNLRVCFNQLARGMAKWPLFLYGPVGTGKTCAALALCDYAVSAAYRTVEDLADDLVNSESLWWNMVEGCELAVLDEIGARERVGDLHYGAIKRFADLRDHKATIYVSNVAPDAITRMYDDRIASRLLCGSWFELGGVDRRMV